MGGCDRGNRGRFQQGYETQVDATRDAVSQLAQDVLQYEWAAYLEAQPPASPHSWQSYDIGKPWARVVPTDWERGREDGFDLHFEHFPTARTLQQGQFRLEFHLEDGVSGDADFSPDSPYTTLRDHIIERLAEADASEMDEWPDGEFGPGKRIWYATTHFPAGDTHAYYEALRTALEVHSPFVEIVTDVLLNDSTDAQ